MDKDHGHKPKTIGAGEFKQTCLALLDWVAETGEPIVVTKRGRPVAKVVPMDAIQVPLPGSVRILTDDEAELFSTGETWEADTQR